MASYWISNPRKFCEFCKCWITDNKASRDFHESGRRHKNNVEKRISQMQRQGVKDERNKKAEINEIKLMEQKALEAMQRDINTSVNLSMQYGVDAAKLGEAGEADGAKKKKQKEKKRPAPPASTERPLPKFEPPHLNFEVFNDTNQWWPTTSPEGYTYYYHAISKEVRWTPPEGYVPPDQRAVTSQGAVTSEAPYRKDEFAEQVLDFLGMAGDEEEEAPPGEGEVVLRPPPEVSTPGTAGEASVSGTAEGEAVAETPLLSGTAAAVADSSRTAESVATPAAASAVMSQADGDTSAAVTSQTDSGAAPADSAQEQQDAGLYLVEVPEYEVTYHAPPEAEGQGHEGEGQEPEGQGQAVVHRMQPPRRPGQPAAYGEWRTVREPTPEKQVDLQLPKVKEKEEVTVVIPIENQPKLTFREKKVNTLGAELEAFRKRKKQTQKGGRQLKKRTDDTM